MYFVLNYETEATLAMCHFKDVAEIIAASLPCKCIIRYNADMHTIYGKDVNFFSVEENKACG